MNQVCASRRIGERAKTGKQLLDKIDRQLRAQHHGKSMIIDADSGGSFLDDTIIEAEIKKPERNTRERCSTSVGSAFLQP
jgi:hypothetical protein